MNTILRNNFFIILLIDDAVLMSAFIFFHLIDRKWKENQFKKLKEDFKIGIATSETKMEEKMTQSNTIVSQFVKYLKLLDEELRKARRRK